MINVNLRLKIIHFFRNNSKKILVVVFILLVIFLFNRYLASMSKVEPPKTSYTKNVPLINSNKKVPKKVSNEFEKFIEQYFEYCNTGKIKEAYNMISQDCKNNLFNNDYNRFEEYVNNKFTNKKEYAIQAYSTYKDKYIYSVKFFDDFLATGLTNDDYGYQEEFMTISYNDKKKLEVAVGNYIETVPLKSQTVNDSLIVTLQKVIMKYEFEIYQIKFENRTNNTIIIQNNLANIPEIQLSVDSEKRETVNGNVPIILIPQGSSVVDLAFSKFYDSGESQSIFLNAVRIVEEYTGTDLDLENEENVINKFSIEIPIEK